MTRDELSTLTPPEGSVSNGAAKIVAASADHEPQGMQANGSPLVAAVVVIYQLTDPLLLQRLLSSLVNQVAITFLIDNTPLNCAKTRPIQIAPNASVVHIPLGDNTGVANAQNIGIARALEEGYSHVLLLDHDSALPPQIVQRLLAAETELNACGERVAAIGPVFQDEKTGDYSTAVRASYLFPKRFPLDLSSTSPVETDHLIASGSLIPANTLRAVGLMRGDFFIDWCDIEWGLRARKMGYKSFICPDAIMRHSIGDASAKFLWKSISLHSDFRNFCFVRNGMYLLRKSQSLSRQWKMAIILKIPKYVVFCPLYSKRPLHCFFLLLRGIANGWSGKLGNVEVH
jgi:rhamnosyltransferase